MELIKLTALGFLIEREAKPRLVANCYNIFTTLDEQKAYAQRLVLCWNEYDKQQERIQLLHDNLTIMRKEYDSLKAKADLCDELAENLLNLTQLLCHPGSFVKAKDIDKAKDVIAKTGKNILWGI